MHRESVIPVLTPRALAAARYWVPVDDEDLWCIARVESRAGGTVQLSRSRAPAGALPCQNKALWPASPAQEADCPRLAEARDGLEHGLAPSAASGEPARLSRLVSKIRVPLERTLTKEPQP